MENRCLQVIAQNLRKLKELSIYECNSFEDRGFIYLPQVETLQKLWLRS